MRRIVFAIVVLAASNPGLAPVTGASAPTAPENCPSSVETFSNTTPVLISAIGPNVVTSAIEVSGAGSYLADADLYTDIKHTSSYDLDVTLRAPAGTIVTITTDNGSIWEDVFAGTTWDDDANPAGQVPYTSNDGLATDAIYTNLAVETPLVPEEPLGAFVGENPNGEWLLTISDDTANDGGSLDAWSLTLTTHPVAPDVASVSASSTSPVAIPSGPAAVTSTIALSGAGAYLADLNLTTNISHSANGDLDVTLRSPAGTVVTVTTDNGGFDDNVFNGTVWDDDADPARQVPYAANDGLVTDATFGNLSVRTPLDPEESFAAFMGEDPNGDWTLTISDDASLNAGSLDSWALDITTATGCTDAVAPAVALTRPEPAGLYVTDIEDQSLPLLTAAVVVSTGTPFELRTDASDVFGVTQVRFLVDDQIVCADEAAPYTCAWTPAPGRHTVGAEASDAAGNISATAPMNVYAAGV